MLIRPALTSVRANLSVFAFGALVLASGHAMAQNHDVQKIKIPPAPHALHDHACGPTAAPSSSGSN